MQSTRYCGAERSWRSGALWHRSRYSANDRTRRFCTNSSRMPSPRAASWSRTGGLAIEGDARTRSRGGAGAGLLRGELERDLPLLGIAARLGADGELQGAGDLVRARPVGRELHVERELALVERRRV